MEQCDRQKVNQSKPITYHYFLWVKSWFYPSWCDLNWISRVFMYFYVLKPYEFYKEQCKDQPFVFF